MKVGAYPALAHGKALYVGDPVAVVIADTYFQAKDAQGSAPEPRAVGCEHVQSQRVIAQRAPRLHLRNEYQLLVHTSMISFSLAATRPSISLTYLSVSF